MHSSSLPPSILSDRPTRPVECVARACACVLCKLKVFTQWVLASNINNASCCDSACTFQLFRRRRRCRRCSVSIAHFTGFVAAFWPSPSSVLCGVVLHNCSSQRQVAAFMRVDCNRYASVPHVMRIHSQHRGDAMRSKCACKKYKFYKTVNAIPDISDYHITL